MVVVVVVSVVSLVLVERNEKLLAQLASDAGTDALTGLLNRRGFDERAKLALAHTRREGSPVALATFDIDYLKRVNDEWGHEMGDRVLTRAGLCSPIWREMSTVVIPPLPKDRSTVPA